MADRIAGTDEQQKQYASHVRGAATFILLGQKDPPIDAREIARTYGRDLALVEADIEAIVQSERHKAGGVFETTRRSDG